MDKTTQGLNAHQVLEGVFGALAAQGKAFQFKKLPVREEMYDEGNSHKYGYYRYDDDSDAPRWESNSKKTSPGTRPFVVLKIGDRRFAVCLAHIYGDYVVGDLVRQIDVFEFEPVSFIHSLRTGDFRGAKRFHELLTTNSDGRFKIPDSGLAKRLAELVNENFLRSFTYRPGTAQPGIRHYGGQAVMQIPTTYRPEIVQALTEKVLTVLH